MRRYGGELIYHGRDEDGVLEVTEAHGVRSLHFGTPPRQSSMSLKEPERLELPYIRAMLSSLLFLPDPERVLLLGLGGGSLARFLLGQYPGCRVEAVERRASVVEIAHAYFALPRDQRLDIHIGDARQRVEALAPRAPGEFDLILIDAYDHLGMDASINAPEFFDACARLLHPAGVVSMNLWGTHAVSLKRSIELLKTTFPGRAFKLAVPNRGNIIGLGLGTEARPFGQKQLGPHALELGLRLGLEMSYFLRNLRLL